MTTTLKRTTIFLTPKQHESLRRLAFQKRVSMAKLVREALLQILEDEEDVREGLKALAEGDEGSVTLDELERKRVEMGARV